MVGNISYDVLDCDRRTAIGLQLPLAQAITHTDSAPHD
jgi:hypothetical protein